MRFYGGGGGHCWRLEERAAGTTGASFLINGDPETDFETNELLRLALAALALNW